VLWNLPADEYNKAAIEAAGGIPPIAELVRSGNDAQKEKATAVLHSTTLSEGAIEPLVNLVFYLAPRLSKNTLPGFWGYRRHSSTRKPRSVSRPKAALMRC
jgi:hypothetical protein